VEDARCCCATRNSRGADARGESIFNTKYGSFEPAKECEQVENGKLVVENPDALKVLSNGELKAGRRGR